MVGYIDYEKQDKNRSAWTYKFDIFFERMQGLLLGGEWFVYDSNINKINNKQFYRSGFSIYGRYTVNSNKMNIFVRYDRYEPNTKVENDEINLVIIGLDFIPVNRSFRIQPNIWLYTYADPENKRDMIFNLTFYYTF